MKLTRKQELYLIDLGLSQVIDNLMGHVKSKRTPWNKGIRKNGLKKARKWTKEQRAKYAETMKRKWGNRSKAAH